MRATASRDLFLCPSYVIMEPKQLEHSFLLNMRSTYEAQCLHYKETFMSDKVLNSLRP
jgi:hypothetical protein